MPNNLPLAHGTAEYTPPESAYSWLENLSYVLATGNPSYYYYPQAAQATNAAIQTTGKAIDDFGKVASFPWAWILAGGLVLFIVIDHR